MKQPFIHSPIYETVFIILPSFFVIIFILLLGSNNEIFSRNETWIWVGSVVLIDVAHVYATFFRTYFDQNYFKKNRSTFILIPFFLFVISFIIYNFLGYHVFWRFLAYIAVFHFVRQQYGFFMIYSGKNLTNFHRNIGKLAIYATTVYPIIHWHFSGKKKFNWFVEGDFYNMNQPAWDKLFFSIYLFILFLYVIIEVRDIWKKKNINIPKNLILIGTGLSWYLGIVYFNNDVLFTILNIVSHGVPYVFFVFLFGYRNYKDRNDTWLKYVFQPWGILIFVFFLWLLAYTEEGLWDTFIWHEHDDVFPFFNKWRIDLDNVGTILVTCILTLPQLTHYILDGIIWKRNQDNTWLIQSKKSES